MCQNNDQVATTKFFFLYVMEKACGVFVCAWVNGWVDMLVCLLKLTKNKRKSVTSLTLSQTSPGFYVSEIKVF